MLGAAGFERKTKRNFKREFLNEILGGALNSVGGAF